MKSMRMVYFAAMLALLALAGAGIAFSGGFMVQAEAPPPEDGASFSWQCCGSTAFILLPLLGAVLLRERK